MTNIEGLPISVKWQAFSFISAKYLGYCTGAIPVPPSCADFNFVA